MKDSGMTTLDQKAIQALLPHRYPILLPQSVRIRTPGELGVGRLQLELGSRLWGEWRARDLFRELVLEGAAQVLGLVLASARADEPAARAGEAGEARHLLLGFNGVQFAPDATPVPALDIEATLVQRMGGMCRGHFIARRDGNEIARGDLTVMQG
jgi:3-hydroxymyristoyl/3-hydroxydecanoyl-(acyl carrier protein) dehydratase